MSLETPGTPSRIESREGHTFSGQLGIVLLLEKALEEKAVALESKLEPGNSIDLGRTHTAHVTLYHSKLHDVPEATVESLLASITQHFPLEVTFTEVTDFGGKFLFWNIERSKELTEAHEKALALAGFFTPEGEQQADKEGITLSPQEETNVRTYGHPLVQELWQPHITLGYYPEGVAHSIEKESAEGKVLGAAFVRIGVAGTVAEIISEKRTESSARHV